MEMLEQLEAALNQRVDFLMRQDHQCGIFMGQIDMLKKMSQPPDLEVQPPDLEVVSEDSGAE